MSAFGSCTPRFVLMTNGRVHPVVLLHSIVATSAALARGDCSGGNPSSLGAQVGEIEPRVEQTNQQFEEAAAAQRAAERNLRQLHSKVQNVGQLSTGSRVTC
jgi:hypothetical protein